MMVFNPQKELNPDPVPAGKYLLELDTHREDVTQNGDDMYVMEWVVSEGEHRGRKIFDNLVMKETAGFRLAQLFEATFGDDVDIDFDSMEDALKEVLHVLRDGKEIKAGIKIDTYENKKRNKVERYLHPDTPLDVTPF